MGRDIYIMCDKVNKDKLSKVLERIFNERNDGYDYKVTIADKVVDTVKLETEDKSK